MYRFFADLLQPFTVLYLLTALGLALQWRRRETSRRRLMWVTVPFLILTVVCLPAVAFLAIATLEWQHPHTQDKPADIEAIVVLSGYAYRPNPTREETMIGMDSRWRCLHAAKIYQQGEPCPIVVTGGKVEIDDIGPPLADLMRDCLIELGVAEKDIWIEDQSTNTYQNAALSKRLLDEHSIRRILLVTQATHLPRAVRCFAAQGFDVTASGCDYRTAEFNWSPLEFVPRADAAMGVQMAAHEWLGMLYYWAHGYFDEAASDGSTAAPLPASG